MESIKSFLKTKIFAVIRNIKEKKSYFSKISEEIKLEKNIKDFRCYKLVLDRPNFFAPKKVASKSCLASWSGQASWWRHQMRGARPRGCCPPRSGVCCPPEVGQYFMLKKILFKKFLFYNTGKSFRNLIKSTWKQIVFPFFWLICNQPAVRCVPNQSENGKYNLISVWFNKISKKFLCVQWNAFSRPLDCNY